MLPFSKRTPRADEAGEAINTGEFEVIRVGATPKVGQVARVPAMPAAQARAFQRSISDDERTMVMPQKSKSSPPPGFIASPTPSTSLAPSVKTAAHRDNGSANANTNARPRPPMSMANDEHTIVRPHDLPKGAFAAGRPSPVTAPTPAPAADAKKANAAPAINAPGNAKANVANGPDSGGLIDVPATVITTRTRILTGRPTVSWAAALMAMGVFVGLVSAVVARGDTDALIDATASFVDPSHTVAKVPAAAAAQPAAAPVVAQMMPVAVAPPAAAPVAMSAPAPAATTCAADAPKADMAKSSTDAKLAEHADKSDKSDKTESKHSEQAKSVDAKPEAKVAASVRRWTVPSHEVKAAPKPAAPKAEKVAAAEKPEKTEKVEKKAVKVESESESASAADALARAQLEASLK